MRVILVADFDGARLQFHDDGRAWDRLWHQGAAVLRGAWLQEEDGHRSPQFFTGEELPTARWAGQPISNSVTV